MSIVDWIFVIGIAITIVLLFGVVYFLSRSFALRKQIKKMTKFKVKNKKKRRALANKRRQLLKKKKRSIQFSFLLFFLSLAIGGALSYLSYYQAMNLTSEDSDAVVKGYYLVRDLNEQLEEIKAGSLDEEKAQKNIRYLATAMASYGTKKASTVNSQEGQLTLNRYYNAIKEVGMNASTQTKNFYGNPGIIDAFLADLKKVQTYEKATFGYYKVDETAFSKE